MKLHRFVCNVSFAHPHIVLEDRDVLHQLTRVLRLKVGESLILCNGKGQEGRAVIEKIGPRRMDLTLITTKQSETEPSRIVRLYCALLKRENFELVVQKATEIGVSEIIPVITARTIKLQVKPERLERIITEAVEQSGRGSIPVLHAPLSFDDAQKHAEANDANLFFDLYATQSVLQMGERLRSLASVGVFIGPEGGWEPSEAAHAKGSNYETVTLGALTLRAETAALIASYLAVSLA